MLNRLSVWMYKISTDWVALGALLIFLLFTALVLPAQAQQANTISSEAGSPDLSFYYSSADLYRMAEAYGTQGRAAFVRARFTFDLIWPLVYTLFLGTALSWVYGKAFTPTSRWRLANLAPVIGAGLDYLENLSTSLVMLRYPVQTPGLDMLASFFTAGKWIFVYISFFLLLAGVLVGIWRWSRRRART